MEKKKGIIAIDADGVMLDYNLAFGKVYEEAFNKILVLQDEKAFHATKMWGLSSFTAEEKKEFYKLSDIRIWRNMPAIKDSIEGVNKLSDLGYEIVCVTSMPPQFEADRLYNLQSLGFKIDRVIATNRVGNENPKKKYIEELKPLYFIEDQVKNFDGIEGDIQLVFVEREYSDDPNVEYNHIPYHLTVSSLKEFAEMIEKMDTKNTTNKQNKL